MYKHVLFFLLLLPFFFLSIVLREWRTFTHIFLHIILYKIDAGFFWYSSFVSITLAWIFCDRSQRVIELVRKEKVIDDFPNTEPLIAHHKPLFSFFHHYYLLA